jgi:cyclopropane fatty-acyl-phospholipid synthase-like methyltransferase
MLNFIGNQFKKPEGFGGKVISFMMKNANKIIYDKVIQILNISQNDRILEIGYGHGIGINMIASSIDCYVTGIDFSELMFLEAQKRNKIHIENKKVDLHFGDFLDRESVESCYDKIFCINVVYFWDNLEKPFLKIQSELKKGGVFCIYMAHRDNLKKMKFTKDDIFNKYTIERVTEELKSAGFVNIEYKYDNGYFITCRKNLL